MKFSCYLGIKYKVEFVCRYDVEYMKYYTNINVKLTTGFSGFYTKGNPYKPTKPEILGIGIEHVDEGTSLVIKRLKKVYPRYTLSNLMSHKVSRFQTALCI